MDLINGSDSNGDSNKLDSQFYPSCPNSSIETFWSTEMSTISSAVGEINTAHSMAKSIGYVSTTAIGSAENLTNVLNYLSCSNLKLWGRIGHGYSGGLQLANHETLSSFPITIQNKGIIACSPGVFNQPFKSRVFGAGANWFIGGICLQSSSYLNCWADKALRQMDVCLALNLCTPLSCMIGCEGQDRIIPPPASVGPTPTPDNSSCKEYCGLQVPKGCWCDDLCDKYNDCCEDKQIQCGSG